MQYILVCMYVCITQDSMSPLFCMYVTQARYAGINFNTALIFVSDAWFNPERLNPRGKSLLQCFLYTIYISSILVALVY